MSKIKNVLKSILSVVFSVNIGGTPVPKLENGYYQSYYKPTNPEKCININPEGKLKGLPSENIKKDSLGKPPYARSSYESRMFTWLDLNKNVLEWGSEVIQIDYINRNDRKLHRYWLDIYMVMRHSDGIVRKHIVEVKPLKKLTPPKMPKKKTKRSMFNYENAMAEYVQNDSKWASARIWAKSKGMVFSTVTQEELFDKPPA